MIRAVQKRGHAKPVERAHIDLAVIAVGQ